MITNKLNGKKYVGQTTFSAEHRMKEHIRLGNSLSRKYPLYVDMNKYGVENFELSVLETDVSSDDLWELEQYYIAKYDTVSSGYNMTRGGGGIVGYHHTDETKQHLHELVPINYDKMYTEERNKKISKALKGRKLSEEHKNKLSAKASERVGSKNPFFGKVHSDATKRKISLTKTVGKYAQIDVDTGEIVNVFDTIDDVYEYIIDEGLSTAKRQSVAYRIYSTVEGRQCVAYGYKWKRLKV